ncbi:hypothetical protein DRO57_06840 [Candidatus Bathyarchaeota archaeon]|nr:MAG: hypothetical protein DRO57_06840 [Candidatus Bathyarchaeota archaeon]
MGFSNTICAAIILIGLLVMIGSAATTFFLVLEEGISSWVAISRAERLKLDIGLQLNIASVGDRAINITVRNTGSRTIFLVNSWNDVIVAYNASGYWRPFLSNFDIEQVRVAGSETAFSPLSHPYINPGEEAVITIQIPAEAPDIPHGSVVMVVFVTHYGVSAVGEAVKP